MANRFWRGGTGTWDTTTTTNWSTTSGGAGGASVPTSADDVFFDQASSTSNAAYTVTLTGSLNCRSISIDGPHPTDVNKVTFSGSGSITCAGGVTTIVDFIGTSAGITWSATGTLTVNSTGNVNFSDVPMLPSITFGGASTLTSDIIWNPTSTGTITFNGNVSGGIYGIQTSPTANITVAGTGSPTLGKFIYTGDATINRTITWSNSGTFTISTTFTITGNSPKNRVNLTSNQNFGTRRTITTNGTNTLNNVIIDGITGAGSASWDLSGNYVGDGGNNSGITFPTGINCYYVSNTGNFSDDKWYTTSGGATPARIPLPQDNAILDANSFTLASQTLTFDLTKVAKLDCSAVTNNPTLGTFTGKVWYGLNIGTCTIAANPSVTMYGDNASINMGGKSIGTFAIRGVITLTGDLTSTQSTLGATGSTLNFGTYTLQTTNNSASYFQLGNINLQNGTLRIIDFRDITFAGGTITTENSTIEIRNSANTIIDNIVFTNKTVNNVILNLISGTELNGVSFSGANLNILTITGTFTGTYALGSGTINVKGLKNGTTSRKTISFSTMAKAGGGLVRVDGTFSTTGTYSPTNTWYLPPKAGMTNSSGGTNAIFTEPPNFF